MIGPSLNQWVLLRQQQEWYKASNIKPTLRLSVCVTSPSLLCSFRRASDCVPAGGELPQHYQQQHVLLGPAGPLCQNRVSQQGGDGRRTETCPQGALHLVRVRHPETRSPVYSQILPSRGGPNLAEHLQGGHCAAPLSQGREHSHIRCTPHSLWI